MFNKRKKNNVIKLSKCVTPQSTNLSPFFGNVGPQNPSIYPTVQPYSNMNQLTSLILYPYPAFQAESSVQYSLLQCHYHHNPSISSIWFLSSLLLYFHSQYLVLMLRVHLHLATILVPKLVLYPLVKALETFGDLNIKDWTKAL